MSNLSLLLADDSVTIQKVINLTFADEGYEVIAVSDGDSALEKVYEKAPDIVLADVNMPGLTGYQLCERIKSSHDLSETPVILLVGSFEPFDEAEARRVGADDVLTKPFHSIRELVAKVNNLLSTRQPAKRATAVGGSFIGGYQRVSDADASFQSGFAENEGVESSYTVTTEADSPLELEDELSSEIGSTVDESFNGKDFNESAEENILSTDREFSMASSVKSADFASTYRSESYTEVSERSSASFVDSEATSDVYSFDDGDDLLQLPVDEEEDEEGFEEEYAESEREALEETYEAPAQNFEMAPTVEENYSSETASESASQLASTEYEEVMPASNDVAKEKVVEIFSGEFSPEMIDAIARRVVEQLSDRVVREIAWEVVPPLAESAVEKMTRDKMKQ